MDSITYSLTDFITHLRDEKHRSPQTIDLYTRSMKACNIDVISKEEIPRLWTQLRQKLDSGEVGAIFIEKTKSLIRGSMRLKAWKFEPTEDYQYLLNKFGRDSDILEYTDEEIHKILAITYYDFDLFNACILQSLSGLRAGALEGLKWTDFHVVESVQDVMIYRVVSKGRPYTPAISTRVFNFIKQRSITNGPYIVNLFDAKTPFTRRLYDKLYWLLVKKHDLVEQLDLGNKSLQHSMRHYFATQVTSVLDEEEASVLTGHKVYKGTLSKYVNKRIKKIGALPLPAYQQKIAVLYKQTPPFNYKIEEIQNYAPMWRKF
jgi:integrase